MWLSAKDHLRFASVPWSTRGGTKVSGFWASRSGFEGPTIVAPVFPLIGCSRVETSVCSNSGALDTGIDNPLVIAVDAGRERQHEYHRFFCGLAALRCVR